MYQSYSCSNCGYKFTDWFHTVQCPSCDFQTLSYVEMLHFRLEEMESRYNQLNQMVLRLYIKNTFQTPN